MGENERSISLFYKVQEEDNLQEGNIKIGESTATTKKMYCCQFCPSQFDKVLSLYGHLNTHKNEVFNCPVNECKLSFSSLKTYRKHMSGTS